MTSSFSSGSSQSNTYNLLKKDNIQYIHHKVAASDTLVNISLRYSVSIAELCRTNHLFSSDIWFKKELLIPVPQNKLQTVKLLPAAIQNNAVDAQNVAAVSQASGCNSAIAREHLIFRNYNFESAVCDSIWTNRMMRKYGVSPETILDFLAMYRDDYQKAENALQEIAQDNSIMSCCFPHNRRRTVPDSYSTAESPSINESNLVQIKFDTLKKRC